MGLNIVPWKPSRNKFWRGLPGHGIVSLDDRRIDGIIEEVQVVIRQKYPIGTVRAGWTVPNGLTVEQVSVPLGVAVIILRVAAQYYR